MFELLRHASLFGDCFLSELQHFLPRSIAVLIRDRLEAVHSFLERSKVFLFKTGVDRFSSSICACHAIWIVACPAEVVILWGLLEAIDIG